MPYFDWMCVCVDTYDPTRTFVIIIIVEKMTERQYAYRGVHLIDDHLNSTSTSTGMYKERQGFIRRETGGRSTARWRNSIDCISMDSCKFPEGSFELVE